MAKEKVIGWAIIVAAVIIALIVSARGAIFNGEPLSETPFFFMLIISCGLLVGYAVWTMDKKKK